MDTNVAIDIFLYDRVSGTVTLVSRSAASAATAGNAGSSELALSADGRFVVFVSEATDLVPGQIDTNGTGDIFLFDRAAGTTTLVSHASGSAVTTANSFEFLPRISADGNLVTFSSSATDLVAGITDMNGAGDAYLYDRTTGTTTLVSHAAGAPTTTADQFSRVVEISADGTRLLLLSNATNIVPGQLGPGGAGFFGPTNAFLYDRVAGTVTLASGSGGSAALVSTGSSHGLRLSADGSTVAMTSNSSDLVAGDLNGKNDAFVFTTTPPGSYFTLTPCRLIDTRQAQHGPALASGIRETWTLHGFCGIPATARAVAVNVTVTQPAGLGHLTLWSGDGAAPLASTLNFGAGQTRANNAILPLSATGSGTLAIHAAVTGGGTVHVLVDAVGYFE